MKIMTGCRVFSIYFVKIGYRDVWLRPEGVDMNNFHKLFNIRLRDQYKQEYISKINNSDRYKVISSVNTEFKRSEYLDKIKNPDIWKNFYQTSYR